jgi:hypothetical protein
MNNNQNLNLDSQPPTQNTQITNTSTLKEVRLIETLDNLDQSCFIGYRKKSCCSCCSGKGGIPGKINNFLTLSIIALIFSISTIITSYNFVSDYDKLRNILLLKIEKENNETITSWCNIKMYQNIIFISNLILILLLLVFEIIQKVYTKTIIEKEKKQGIVTSIMIIGNSIFYFCFLLMSLISFYFMIYEIIVIGNKPFSIDNKKYGYYSETDTTEPEKSEEEQLYEGIFIYGLINIFLLLILLIFNTVLCFMNIMIFIYLDLNYEENEINNFNYNNNIITVNNINTINYINSRNDINDTKTNNQNSINIINNKTDIIKKTTINFRGKIIIVQIKPNKNIYLLDNNSKEVHIFKEILMEGITKNFIYIRIKDEIIQDMLSTTDWEFPKVDQMFILIKNSFNYIFVEICFLPLSLYFQASKEHMYYQIKDNIKTNVISNIENVNIFNYYGNFEKGVTESRFILYFIALIILFIFMIKRFLYGGKRYSCLDIISLILSIMLNLMNIIYLVLTIILIVYAFRSLSVVDDYKKKYNEIFD